MDRLAELQGGGGGGGSFDASAFSPQNNYSTSFEPPSAEAEGQEMSNKGGGGGGGGKTVSFVGIGEAADDFNNKNKNTSANADDDDEDNGGGGNRGDSYQVIVEDEALDAALKIIEKIQNSNREIQQKTMQLRTQTAENMKNFNPAAETDEGASAIEDIMDSVSALSKEIKANLDSLSENTKELEKDETTKANNAGTIKIQQNQHNHLTRQFMQYINDYNNAVSDNEKQLREQAVRRIKLKYTKSDGSTVSDDEARQMAAQVLEFGRTDMLFHASKEVLASVLETRQDILRIERSMRELKQIMDDLSSLINEQGEIMDVILSNVQNSVQYVKSGRDKLQSARGHAKAASSKMKWLCLCIVMILGLVLALALGLGLPT